jgi:hypothetical protein
MTNWQKIELQLLKMGRFVTRCETNKDGTWTVTVIGDPEVTATARHIWEAEADCLAQLQALAQ